MNEPIQRKTLKKLLIKRISDKKIDISCIPDTPENIIYNLKKHPKYFNSLKNYIPDIDKILEQLYLEEQEKRSLSKYVSFTVFGCPTSTDIDIVVFVLSEYLNHSVPYQLSDSEITRLKAELTSIGYDTENKKIDINIMCIEDRRCIGSSKGGGETINICNATHTLHRQLYEIPHMNNVEIILLDRLYSIAKKIMDIIKYTTSIDNYKMLRETRKEHYEHSNYEEKLIYSIELLKRIDLTNHTAKWYDCMKSLVMKIIQLIIFIQDNLYLYTKPELAECISCYGFCSENAKYLLFRGKQGIFTQDELIKLFTYYQQAVDNYLHQMKSICFPIEIKDNCTLLPTKLYEEFISSPKTPTKAFQELFNSIYGENYSTIHRLFPIESTPLCELYRLLPSNIIDKHFIQVSQRDDEWHKLMNYYQCGRNSGINIKDTIDGMYNLLRGSIYEAIILKNIQDYLHEIGLDGWIPIQTGLLVAEKEKKGSFGCAPDLLLVNDGKIIPVEIKASINASHNSDFLRKIDLAQRQLTSVENILGKDIIYKKLIIISYWTNTLNIECFFI